MRLKPAVLLVAILTLTLPACAPPPPPQTIGPADSHAAVAAALSEYIEQELADKEIPALSIALVDGNEIVWARGFGMADPEAGVPATASTLYRVGSVSKLFTDIGVMQLVERGEIDLDAPIQTYLPEFRPENPFGVPITLRQLMSHRSGLVREPPVGNYFDASEPSVEATVASLNDSSIVYEPESDTKYSNAGITVVGHVLEALSGEPFADHMASSVLSPMDLNDSSFLPGEELRSRLAKATMWSYDGRTFPAPVFEFGMAPAANLYSTVTDLARFLLVLFDDGRGPSGPVLQPETVRAMLEPQYSSAYGIGFGVGELGRYTTHGHAGAVYGFATELRFVHEERVGVAIAASMDVVNTVASRIGRLALEMLLAQHRGEELPLAPSPTTPVDLAQARAVRGRYELGDYAVRLTERNSELYLDGRRSWSRVRDRDGVLTLDDRLANGPELAFPEPGVLAFGPALLTLVDSVPPPALPERFEGLIGEYGWDHSVLFVYEKEGALHALIEWIEIDWLTEVGEDVFAFPRESMYHGEHLEFRRDRSGRAHEVVVAGITFPRREIQGETVDTFRIEPVRPVAELREEALAAEPPVETFDFEETELVELVTLDPSIRLDIRYATDNNFMGTTFYPAPRAFLQRPAAEALVRVHRSLAEHGFGLLIHDAYRPWYVTKMFWDATPEEGKIFVADPAEGSRHNRGAAVDLTLFDLATGEPIEMVGLYDEMSARSYSDYMGGTSRQRWHRDLLRAAMEAEGFRVYEYEWWHFDFDGWERYRIGNQTFDEIVG
jgi:CubicO group peptidase (beta-lactamase class C family)/D-alanyl-D-alanine dipeptidase